MNWEVVKIPENRRGRTTPYASVGFGRLSLSAAACELIENHETIKHVELLKGKINNKLCIGVRLLREPTANSLAVSRKKDANGNYVTGMDISNKRTIEELFGPAGSAQKTTRYNVRKDEDADNILIISAE